MSDTSSEARKVIPLERLERARREREDRSSFLQGHDAQASFHDRASHAALALARENITIDRLISDADARIEPDEDDLALADEFPVPSTATRAAAKTLAIELMHAMWRIGHVPAPIFEVAGNGGIGIHWSSIRVDLLVVVPPELTSRVLFLAQAPGCAVAKGWFLLGNLSPLPIEWFVKRELQD